MKMPRVRLFFGLRDRKGRTEFTVEPGALCDVLRRIQELVPERIVEDCSPAPGYLIFVDRVDVRLLPHDCLVGEESTVDIVPVNHPG